MRKLMQLKGASQPKLRDVISWQPKCLPAIAELTLWPNFIACLGCKVFDDTRNSLAATHTSRYHSILFIKTLHIM